MKIIILVTTKDKAEAEKISKILLTKKLIACANLIEGVDSHFWWQGKIDRAGETLLILKTTQSKFTDIEKEVKVYHSYEMPEIIALPIVDGNTEYLNWISDSTKDAD